MLLNAQGLPATRQRAIPDEVLQAVLSNHEKRLNAVGAQVLHGIIMVEFLTKELEKTMPDFDIDDEEFALYRDTRWQEMQKGAQEAERQQKAAMEAADEAKADVESGNPSIDPSFFDLDELDDIEDAEPESNDLSNLGD